MKRAEHLLTILAEECCEVGQRVSKALRFGLDEVQKDQPLSNADRILEELHDLFSVAAILHAEGVIGPFIPPAETVSRKLAKIERYFAISREQGTLEAGRLALQANRGEGQ